jgi:hypothetical protein
VHALVPDQLPEEENDGRVSREERLKALRVPVIREAFVRVARVRRILARSADQVVERLGSRLRVEKLDVDAGRHLVDSVDVADDLIQHLADVLGADDDGARRRERLPPPG